GFASLFYGTSFVKLG
ncbi:unnamed protein product, partial [Oikopleura dioica]